MTQRPCGSRDARRVLIVSKHPECRAEIRELLRGAEDGYELSDADSGATALAEAFSAGGELHCMILDDDSPDVTVADLLRALGGPDGLPVCPVVVVTTKADRDVGTTLLRCGAQDYLPKDWLAVDRLGWTLEKAAERWRTSKALKEGSERLRVATERFSAALSASGVVVFEQDPELRYTWIDNPALGFTSGEVVGRTDRDLFEQAADAETTEALKRAVLNDGVARRAEVSVTGRGVTRTYELAVQAKRDPSGAIVGVTCAAIDVTTRKMAEEAVQASEKRAQAAARQVSAALIAAEVGTFEWDIRRQRVGGDSNFAQMFGVAVGVDGSADLADYIEVIHPGDRARVNAAIASTVATGTDYEVEYRVRSQGRTRWLLVRARAERDDAGEISRASGVCLDITPRREVEESLRLGEHRLRLALEASDTGLWEWEPESDSVAWTTECYRIHGLTQGDFDLTGAGFFRLVHPEDRERVQVTIRAAIASQSLYEAEFRITRPGGDVAWVANRGRARYDDGGALRVLGTITDISTRKRAEEALLVRNEQLDLLARVSGLLLHLDQRPEAELVAEVFGMVSRLIGADLSYHRLGLDSEHVHLHDVTGVTEAVRSLFARTPRQDLFCVDIADAQTQLIVEDFQRNAGDVWPTLKQAGVTCYAEFPLVADGGVVGTVAFVSLRQLRFGQGHTRTIRTVCEQVGAALDRARLMRELARSEGFARSVVEASSDCVKGLSPDGRLLWMNENGMRLMEVCDFNTVAGSDWSAFWDGGARVEAAAALAEARKGGIGRFVGFCPTAAGTPRWWDVAVTPIFAPDGEVEQVLSVSRDITEARSAEQKIRDSESFYRQTLESMPGMVFISNADGECAYVNEQWVNFTGVPRTGQLATDWLQTLHPDDRLAAESAWRVAVESLREYDVEYRVRRHDGSYQWFKVRGRAIQDAAGRVVRWFTTALNIDSLKRIEAELKARERQLQALADNTPDILTRFDPDLRHVFVNAAVQKATGLPCAEFLGKTNRELGMPDAMCSWWDAVLTEVFVSGEGRSIEFPFATPEGIRHYSALFVPEFGPQGQVEHVLGVTHDVTESKRYEHTMLDQGKRKDEFLATLAHELRNPLAPIRNGLQLLRMAGGLTDAVEKTRAMMERQVSHLVNLVDDLLDISRVSQGKISLRPERLTAREVVEAAVEACKPTLDAKGHTLGLRLSSEPLNVEGDRTRLVQIVSNLLTNAAKYSEDRGHITVETFSEGGQAVIRVADTGVGIAPEVLPTLWDMFTQVRDTLDKAQGGLGVGLSLVKKLVEMHGGTVAAHSQGIGQGSVFTINLPLVSGVPPVSRVLSNEEPQSSAPRRTTSRVLVVDDNGDGADTMAMMLDILGYETTVASTGPEALEVARRLSPALVFCDIGLPGMDGYEVARALRGDPETTHAMLVALTGWGSDEDKRRSQQAGFDFHLTKPVDLAAVQSVLSKLTSAAETTAGAGSTKIGGLC